MSPGSAIVQNAPVPWGFRKTKTILPGVRLSLGRRSAGLSLGRRGARVGVNTKGRRTLSLSKLGFFWRRRF
jgi:hypothetical protein